MRLFFSLEFAWWDHSPLWRVEYEKPMRTWHEHSHVNLQAGVGTAPSCRREREQNSAPLLYVRIRMFTPWLQTATVYAESSNHRFLLFPITTRSCYWLRYPTSLFAPVHNKLAGGGGGWCVSPPEHPVHLIPAFCMFVFCPFSVSRCSKLGC
jgi:hypothetical protein